MYQVLEMFENRFIFTVLIEALSFCISDLLLECLLIILSYCMYLYIIDNGLISSNNVIEFTNELIKDLISSVCVQQIGTNKTYIVFMLMSIFVLLLFLNIYGLIPYSYSITSQVSVTVFLSFSICCGVTLIGFLNMSFNYLYLFITEEGEMPTAIVPFLILIEFLSYSARYFSLGLRLFANMMAGHSLMVILSKFFLNFFDSFLNIFDILLLFIFFLMLSIVLLEIGVSLLQAYVFVLLITIYMSEAVSINEK